MPEVKSGAEFRMVNLTQQILDKYLTLEQQQVRIKKANSDQTEPLHSIVKFFASFIAKQNDLFVRVRPGIYRAHSEDEIAAAEEGITDAQIEDVAIADGDVEAVEFDGWVYAFSFPAPVRPDAPFPIKIGMTTGTVEERVAFQCKGSAMHFSDEPAFGESYEGSNHNDTYMAYRLWQCWKAGKLKVLDGHEVRAE